MGETDKGGQEYEERARWLQDLGAEQDGAHPERGWRIAIEPLAPPAETAG